MADFRAPQCAPIILKHGSAQNSHYPDKRLHKVAKPVAVVDDRIRRLVADMAETMYAAPGVGLAATQVDVHERVIVIDVSDAHDELQVFINPEIVWSSDARRRSRKRAACRCRASTISSSGRRKCACGR